jgi:cytidylate kinase
VNGGGIFRDEDDRRGISVGQFSQLCKNDLDVDRSLDTQLKEYLTAANGPDIVESRLSGWWASNLKLDCLRVWVKVTPEESASRIQTREGGDLETRLIESETRQSDDKDRYRLLYDIDLDDMSPYNLIIDATGLSAEEVFELVNNKLEN